MIYSIKEKKHMSILYHSPFYTCLLYVFISLCVHYYNFYIIIKLHPLASVGKAVSQTGLGYGSTRRIENGSSRKLRGGVRLVQLKLIIASLIMHEFL